MLKEPSTKRVITFIDGQNLFHSVRESFGYGHPNYDILALSSKLCEMNNWQLGEARFYTGVPDPSDNPFWNEFWAGKLRSMSRQGVYTFSRSLRYRNKKVKLPDGSNFSFLAAEEKGIDVRIAIDVIRMAHTGDYDVALIFSQDQDLSEVATEVRAISKEQGRWLKIASAYPLSPTTKNKRGINKTDWIHIERKVYDACIDWHDYRSKKIK